MKRLKEISILILTLFLGVFLFILVLKNVDISDIIAGFRMLQPLWLLVALVIFFSLFFVDIYRWKTILNSYGHKPKFYSLVVSKFAEFALSYLTPIFYVGGEGARAIILKKREGISASDGIRTIIIDKLIEAFMLCAMLIFSAILLLVKSSSTTYLILAIIMLGIGFGGILFFYRQIHNDKNLFKSLIAFFRLYKIKYIREKQDKICNIEDEVYCFFKKSPAVFLKAIGLSIISTFLYVILFKFILFSLGIEVSIFIAILIRSLAIVISLVPIPAALGVYEGSFTYAFRLLGLGQATGINFSLIMRFFYGIWVIIGLIYFSHFGISFVSNILENGKAKE